MMRRNVISLVKFFFLAVFTVFLTVIIFRYIRRPHNRESTSPQVPFALIEDGRKLPMDLARNFNKQVSFIIYFLSLSISFSTFSVVSKPFTERRSKTHSPCARSFKRVKQVAWHSTLVWLSRFVQSRI